MSERPLILFGHPALSEKEKRHGGGSHFSSPTYSRQIARIAPKFEILQNALENGHVRMTNFTTAIDPEYTVVFETVGDPDGFYTAIKSLKRQYPNVEWIMELSSSCPNSEDFYVLNKQNERDDTKYLSTKVFCVMTNREALAQILSLWSHYKKDSNYAFPHGFSGFKHLFETLNDVHQWGIQERLYDTGILDAWREDLIDTGVEILNAQIELFFRTSSEKRISAEQHLRGLVEIIGGRVLSSSVIPEINYHAMLVSIPREYAQKIVNQELVELILADEIMFMKSVGQTVFVGLNENIDEDLTVTHPSVVYEEPIVAVFDGMPQENHPLLAGLLSVDDPDGLGTNYPVDERIHGTSMASLILRGQALDSISDEIHKIYIRPVMKSRRDFNESIEEYVPDDFLLVDKIHECVRRLFEPAAGRVAPTVRVINLSIGISYREYYNMISPLARLLDWLSYKYRVLFVVSAGNHGDPILLGQDYASFALLSDAEKDAVIAKHIAENIQNLRLLSPAESMNALTVGAVFDDTNKSDSFPGLTIPQSAQVPAAYSSFGRGINNAIKPDILYNGGRNLVRFDPTDRNAAQWRNSVTKAPGIKSAYPGVAVSERSKSGYSCGTSNSAALISNQAAACYDVLNNVFVSETGSAVPYEYSAVLIKAMLAHGASWKGMENTFTRVLNLSGNQIKNTLHKFLGYGITDVDAAKECTKNQITLIGFGEIKHGQAYEYELPLPFNYHTQRFIRKLIVTLAYFSPIRPSSIKYRETQVWVTLMSGKEIVGSRAEYDFNAVQRGALQHEVFESDSINVWDENNSLSIKVNCRNDAAAEREERIIPYALFVTYEMAPEHEIDVYQRVVDRVRIREEVAPQL